MIFIHIIFHVLYIVDVIYIYIDVHIAYLGSLKSTLFLLLFFQELSALGFEPCFRNHVLVDPSIMSDGHAAPL